MTSLPRPVGPVAALLALAAGLAGCSLADGTQTAATAPSSAVVAGQAPILASATLTDDVDAAAGTWSTTWGACFAPLPGEDVERWEVQAVTTEGASPRVEQLPGECVELHLARGTDAAPADDPGRVAALADAAALAYQVRGVRADGSVTPWSEPVVAGSVR
ncbi:MAG: hypothetical protein M3Q47_12420 [Actinomycetota bacterium]|nr:hypothetical protein [Actinomycetota bacterium]